MRKYQVKCPEELSNELQRINYELAMENTVLDRFIDRHLNDPEALDSPTFNKYAKSVTEKTAEYEMLKEAVTDQVLTGIRGHDADWNLDFSTGIIDVIVRCDCELPFLEEISI